MYGSSCENCWALRAEAAEPSEWGYSYRCMTAAEKAAEAKELERELQVAGAEN